MGLFTQVPGETVWKIGMSPETGVPKAAKRDRRGSNRRLLTVQVVPSRGLRLFSKRFLRPRTPNSPSGGGEGTEVRGLLFVQQQPWQLPRRDELTLLSHRDGASQLLRCHLGVDKTGGAGPEGGPGGRQVQV